MLCEVETISETQGKYFMLNHSEWLLRRSTLCVVICCVSNLTNEVVVGFLFGGAFVLLARGVF